MARRRESAEGGLRFWPRNDQDRPGRARTHVMFRPPTLSLIQPEIAA